MRLWVAASAGAESKVKRQIPGTGTGLDHVAAIRVAMKLLPTVYGDPHMIPVVFGGILNEVIDVIGIGSVMVGKLADQVIIGAIPVGAQIIDDLVVKIVVIPCQHIAGKREGGCQRDKEHENDRKQLFHVEPSLWIHDSIGMGAIQYKGINNNYKK